MQGKFIYIAHFIHSGYSKCLVYTKGDEIVIKNNNHSNKNKELKITVITTIKTRNLKILI